MIIQRSDTDIFTDNNRSHNFFVWLTVCLHFNLSDAIVTLQLLITSQINEAYSGVNVPIIYNEQQLHNHFAFEG